MTRCVAALLVALPLSAAAQTAAPLTGVARSVEKRYNNLRTLKAEFVESISQGGRTRRQERGTLYLLRPGKMRWDYSSPAGKLFVADGKNFFLYSPYSNQVQRLKPRESDDLRAPLSFLLGRLDFSKEFGKLTLRSTPDGIEMVADPRTEREVYDRVTFTIAPQTYQIRRIVVAGRDGLMTEFLFSGEVANPPLQADLFRFQAPAGAEVVESVQ